MMSHMSGKANEKKRLLLIDGHSMAYRAFFALPAENFTTAQGQHTNAIYGFATMLISLLKEEKPTHVAVAFDVSRKTFRTEIFPEYKANRAKTPDEFRSQMSYLHDLVTGFGITQFEVEGFEADDIIATITKRAEKEGAEVLICTGDRDSFQLVSDQTTVLYPKRGVSELARMTPVAVIEKYGMTPAQYPDFAALRGDPSDNLPSIPGVGEKTAAKWIVEYGSLVDLLAQADKVSGKVGDALRAHLESVRRNRELTQLIHDAPIELSIDALAWSGVAAGDLTALFEKLEFRTLKDRLKTIAVTPEESATKNSEPELSLFAADIESSVLTPVQMSEMIAGHHGPIALAFEIHENSLHRFAVAFSAQQAHLVHSAEMGSWVVDSSVEKIAHGAKSLARINGMQGVVFDTELAAYLVNPGTRAQELQDLLDRWGSGVAIDTSSAEQTLLTSACALFALRGSLTQELESRGLSKLFYELELPVAHLLATMENRGIAVDKKALEKLLAFFEAEVTRETKVAHTSAGHEFNVASPKQLQTVLFDELGLPKTKKIKTGYTTDADALNWLFEKTEHPVLAALLRIRETKKLATTIEGLLVEIAADKRIHTHFAQTVAATGRLSSVGPNLQNIPVRTEEGRRIREAFVPAAGCKLLSADYSQIELRIMAHIAEDESLLTAFAAGKDIHQATAAEIFGIPLEQVSSEQRRYAKVINFGLIYGMSAYGLAGNLGIERAAAQKYIATYFERYPSVAQYMEETKLQAREQGYVETVFGRRLWLPEIKGSNGPRRQGAERAAINAPMQGTAADLIKLAMVAVQNWLEAEGLKTRMLLQVHDELVFDVPLDELDYVQKALPGLMCSVATLKVPLLVSIGVGDNWEEAH